MRGRAAGNAQPNELIAQQPLRIQNLGGALALRALHRAVEQIRIELAGAGIIVLDLSGRKRQQTIDLVHHESDRRVTVEHDHPRRFVRRRIRQVRAAAAG